MPIPTAENEVASRVCEASSDLSAQSVIYRTIPLLATNVDTSKLNKVVVHNGLPQVADVVLIDTRKSRKSSRVLPRPRIKRIRSEYESHWAAVPQEVPRLLIILVKTDLTRSSLAKKLLASLTALIEGVDRISIGVVVSRRSRFIEPLLVQHNSIEAEGKKTPSATPAKEVIKVKKDPFQRVQSDADGEKNANYNASMECEVTNEHTLSETAVKTSSDALVGRAEVVGSKENDALSDISEPESIVDHPPDKKNVEKTAVESGTSRIEEVLSEELLTFHRKQKSPEALNKCTPVVIGEEKSYSPLAKVTGFIDGEKQLSDVESVEQQTGVFHKSEGEEDFQEENVKELQEDFLGASSGDEPEWVLEDVISFNGAFSSSVGKKLADHVTAVEADFDEEKQVKSGATLLPVGKKTSEPDLQAPITPSSPVLIEEEAHINVSPQVCVSSSSPLPLIVKENTVHHHDMQASTVTAEEAAIAVELDPQDDEKKISVAMELNEEAGALKVSPDQQDRNTLSLMAEAASKNPSGYHKTSEGNTDDEEKEPEVRESKESGERVSHSEKMYALRKEHFAFFSSASVVSRPIGSSAAQSLLSKHLIDTSPFLPFFSYSFASNSVGNTLGKRNKVVPPSSSRSSSLEKGKVDEKKESKARSFAKDTGPGKVESHVELSVAGEPSFASVFQVIATEGDISEVKTNGVAMEPLGNSGLCHTSFAVKTEDQSKNEVGQLFPRVVHARNDIRSEELSSKPDSMPSSLSLCDAKALQSPSGQEFTESDRQITVKNKKTDFVLPVLQSQTKSAKENLQKSSSSPLSAVSAPFTPPAPSISNKENVAEIKPTTTTRPLSVSAAVDAAPTIDSDSSVTEALRTTETVTASIKAKNESKTQEKASSNLVHCQSRSTTSSRTAKKSEPRKKKSTVSPKQLVPNQKKKTKKEKKESYDFSDDNSPSAQLSRKLREELRQRALQKKMLKSMLKENSNRE